jgi:hypothetical protein
MKWPIIVKNRRLRAVIAGLLLAAGLTESREMGCNSPPRALFTGVAPSATLAERHAIVIGVGEGWDLYSLFN